MKNKRSLLFGAVTFALFSGASVQAEEAEDQSAAFAAQMDALAATLGMSASGTERTVNDDGSVTTNIGLEHLKMLVVRENEDGTLSVGHSSTAEDAVEFINSDDVDAEEQASE